MTEQPGQPRPDDDGRDHASDEQRVARAHKSNDLANALITLRNDTPAAAQLVEDAINADFEKTGHIDVTETIRMLANTVITLTNRIANYARELDVRAGDPDYFAAKHSRVVLLQQANPKIVRVQRKDGEA